MTITTKAKLVLRAEGRVHRFDITTDVVYGPYAATEYRELPEGQAREVLENLGLKPERAARIVKTAAKFAAMNAAAIVDDNQ